MIDAKKAETEKEKEIEEREKRFKAGIKANEGGCGIQ